MKNGTLQITATLVSGALVVGAVWNRISTNAASMRAAIEEVRQEQKVIKQQIEILLKK